MFYKLKPHLLLRGWQKLPYALVDSRQSQTHFLSYEEMEALKLCNGLIDTSLPLIDQKVRDLLPLAEKNGLIERCERGDGIRPEQEYRQYPSRYIRTAHWSITGHCNYRCKHCYMSAPDAKYGELSHEEILSIVQQLIDCGVMEVSLTGGEPLVRKDFMEIVDALLAGGIRITTIYSNGKLVTDQLLDQLDARGIHPEFNMSYDGVGWHDWLRGIDGAEKIVEDAFLRCQAKGFPTGAEMCIHEGNKHTLRQTVNRLAELGCRSLKTNPISDVGAWKEHGYGQSISTSDLYQLYLDYIPHYYEDGMPLSLQLGGFFSASPRRPEEWFIPLNKSYCTDPSKECVCGHARMVMYISAEGRTLPCMSLSGMAIQEQFPLISECGLASCLSDSRYLDLITMRASECLAHNPQCKDCEHAMQCLCGCRAGALEGNPDDLLGIDPFTCQLFKGGWIPKIEQVMQTICPKKQQEN